MTRNGTPVWPGEDDLEHDYCSHNELADFSQIMTIGTAQEFVCVGCDRTVRVHGVRVDGAA